MTTKKSNRYDSRRGFTLIELLLVISILAILSALGVSVLANAEQDALESRTKAGIERLSLVMTQKFENNLYRVLPVRMPPAIDGNSNGTIEASEITTPQELKDFREQAMAEFLRVEFPFLLIQADPAEDFPQNVGTVVLPSVVSGHLTPSDRPQISARYWAKVSSATTTHQSAELLYAILSLNFDEFGQPLSAVLREREIGDTDNDGVKEVLDAFGDPLVFSLVVRFEKDELDELTTMGAIVRDPVADIIGYEVILNENDALGTGEVRGSGPDVGTWPIEKYRFWIRSVNLSSSSSGAVATQ